MTVSSEVSVAGPFYGNGTTTTFPYSFRILDAKHIRAVLISASGDVSDLSLDSGDYSVTGVGSETGGDVIKATPLLAGQTLTLVRRLPLTQETSLENQGAYYPEVVERRLDQMVMQIQSVKETTERSLTVEPGQEKPSMTQIAAAQGYSQAAKTSRDEAGQFAEYSADSASDALGSATLAGRWANAPEDQEVVPSPGLFSAFHWYRKTFAIWNSVIAGWSGAVHDAPLKASPSLADEFGFADSGDSWKIKKQTFAKLQEVFGVPIGATIMVQGNGNTPPPGFLLHNGAPCTSAYPQLRAFLLANGAAINGNGDPIIEDMGGYFPRGWRPGQVVDSDRVFGAPQQDAMEYHEHPTMWEDATNPLAGPAPMHSDNQKIYAARNASGTYTNVGGSGNNNNGRLRGTGRPMSDAAIQSRTANETRPTNKTYTYWIKAYAAELMPGAADLAALTNNLQTLQNTVNGTGTKRGEKATIGSGTAFLYSGIPSNVNKVKFHVRNLTFSPAAAPQIRVAAGANGVIASGYVGGIAAIAGSTGYSSIAVDPSAILFINSSNSVQVLHGSITFTCVPRTNIWMFEGQFFGTPGNYTYTLWQTGGVTIPGNFTGVQLSSGQATQAMSNAEVWADWETMS
jgi:hypothetical protein